jgi:hypothetical protein
MSGILKRFLHRRTRQIQQAGDLYVQPPLKAIFGAIYSVDAPFGAGGSAKRTGLIWGSKKTRSLDGEMLDKLVQGFVGFGAFRNG